jgi:hypothetical protein
MHITERARLACYEKSRLTDTEVPVWTLVVINYLMRIVEIDKIDYEHEIYKILFCLTLHHVIIQMKSKFKKYFDL